MRFQLIIKIGYFLTISIILWTMTAAAAGTSSPLQVRDPWVRPASRTMNAALYLSLHNTGETADALVGARSEVARAVELHESRMEGYIMRMRPVSRLPIPAGGQVTLKPGGFHIMLIDLQQDLKPGDTVTVELRFEKSAPLTITAPVRQP